MTMGSVRERDRQFRLVRVDDEHREELGRFVLLAFALTAWRSQGSSEKLCSPLWTVTGPSLILLRIAPSSSVA